MNSNLIKFQGKLRKGSENLDLREILLAHENLHTRFKSKIDLIMLEIESLKDEDIFKDVLEAKVNILKTHLEIIEQQKIELEALIKE